MKHLTNLAIIFTVLALGCAGLNPGAVQANEDNQTGLSNAGAVADLTGLWILDQKASDDLKAMMAPPPSRGGGMGPGNGGGGGRGGGMGGGRGGGRGAGMDREEGSADQKRMQKNAKDLAQEVSRLEIFQTGSELSVTDGLDISWVVTTDGKENTIWTRRGEAKATASWTGTTLVVETKAGKQKRAQIRHYSLSEDGSELTVLIKRPQGPEGETKTIKLVYRKK